jgi:hypothetical protein
MSIEQMQQSLTENIRVLKVGGKLFMSPIIDFEERPPIADGNGDTKDQDQKILRFLRLLQIKFIDELEKLKISGNYNIQLNHDYHVMFKNTQAEYERANKRAPYSVIITKN